MMDVLFQRVKDVVYKVADGTAQIGVTGFDVVYESPHDDLVVIHDKLGYGHCKLLVAVPQSWVDVNDMADLVEVAQDFRENKGRDLRIATTYSHSTRRFLHSWGIHHFKMVRAEGAIEAAPTIGYADIIVDITQTGTTLRENHLKEIHNGIITESQACLIGNKVALKNNPQHLEAVRTLLEYMDAALQGNLYEQITVNISGTNPEEVAAKVAANPTTRGLLGPTISPIYSANSDSDAWWYTVTITIETGALLRAVEYLRAIGGTQVIVSPVRFVFMKKSDTFADLCQKLEIDLVE